MALEDSILTSTKKILGLAAEYTAFDHDIIVHINSVFSDLHQLGIGPADGFMIGDDLSEVWADYVTDDVPPMLLNSVRTYVYLRVKAIFDPPTTGYLVEATQKQIEKLEWRLNVAREGLLHPLSEFVEEEV